MAAIPNDEWRWQIMGRRGLTWLGLAVAVGASPAPAETTLNALSGFRGWSEPVVRDWRQTNAEVASGAMDHGHMGHGGMDHGSMEHGSMPMTPPDKAVPEPQDTAEPMDHQGMNHGSSSMEPAEKPVAEPAPSSTPKPASAPPAAAPAMPDHGAHGSHHP